MFFFVKKKYYRATNTGNISQQTASVYFWQKNYNAEQLFHFVNV